MSSEGKSIRERLPCPGSPVPDLEAEPDRLRRENADLPRPIIEELLRRLWGKQSEKVSRPEKRPTRPRWIRARAGVREETRAWTNATGRTH